MAGTQGGGDESFDLGFELLLDKVFGLCRSRARRVGCPGEDVALGVRQDDVVGGETLN